MSVTGRNAPNVGVRLDFSQVYMTILLAVSFVQELWIILFHSQKAATTPLVILGGCVEAVIVQEGIVNNGAC